MFDICEWSVHAVGGAGFVLLPSPLTVLPSISGPAGVRLGDPDIISDGPATPTALVTSPLLMAASDERSGSARIAAKAVAAAAYQAHVAAQRSKRWRVGDMWRVAVQHAPGTQWSEPVAPLPGISDVGNAVERQRMGAWLRDNVLEVEGIVLDRDYNAAREGRVAYTVKITR